jgi:hypothetical protein
MLKMVDGTGIIGVDMICPLGVSTPQPPNYDRVELEGTGMLVLPNSLDAPLERLELGGKTEQVQTTGAQLLKPKDGSYTVFGVSVDIANGEIKLSGTATSSGGRTIRLSEPFLLKAGTYSSEVDGKIDFILSKNSDNSYLVNLAVKNFNVNEDTEVYVGLNVMAQNTYNNKYHIMLNSGNIALPYEPYTGGKPSPSPEYPQEIKNSGKWNEETQKYEVDVKVTGKNLLNLQKEPDVKGVYQGWKVGNGESLTLGVKDKGNNADVKGCYIGFSYQGSESNGVVWVVDNGVIKTNPLTQRKAYVSIFPANETTVKKLTERLDIQCELGNVATPYQPYKEQTLTLTSDRPLTKWDRLVEQGGEIGWLYGSVIATIDETASISLYAPNGFYVYVKNIDKKEKTGYCDKLYAKKMSNGEPFVLFGNANNNGLYTLNTQEFYGKTVSEIKEKLKEYPLNIIGKSETTEFVPLPQSEQNAIRALKAYYPTTVITVDGGELDPDIKVTYRKEI